MQVKTIISVEWLKSYQESKSFSFENEPINWFAVQLEAIYSSQGEPNSFSWSLLLRRKAVFFWSSPSIKALLACCLSRRNIYLCWGLPSKSNLKLIDLLKIWKLKFILKLSTLILVNDEITLEDLRGFGLNKVEIFPYVVDTNFFKFSPSSERKEFLLVPGDNDRDEDLINELSLALPYKIVRVTRGKKNLNFYRGQAHSNVDIRFNISFTELCLLYQTARIVMLPIQTDNHAAGQTSILEAMACGAPILISKGRTSSVVSKYASVLEVLDNELTSWVTAINQLLDSMSHQPHILKSVSNRINEVHNPKLVTAKLSQIIQDISQ